MREVDEKQEISLLWPNFSRVYPCAGRMQFDDV